VFVERNFQQLYVLQSMLQKHFNLMTSPGDSKSRLFRAVNIQQNSAGSSSEVLAHSESAEVLADSASVVLALKCDSPDVFSAINDAH
jgi:hypothetical protein